MSCSGLSTAETTANATDVSTGVSQDGHDVPRVPGNAVSRHFKVRRSLAQKLSDPSSDQGALTGRACTGRCVMLSIVHDLAEADVGDITPEHASGVSKAAKLALEEVRLQRRGCTFDCCCGH